MPRAANPQLADLRFAIDCLPQRTREAMLHGVRTNKVIVGNYTDGDGGVCPMLAAHRCGGRTDFALFAKAWDAYTKAPRGRRTRRARPNEVRTLVALLEASLGVVTTPARQGELGGAVAEHQQLARDRRAREAASTGGWGWLRRRREPAPAGGRDAERELIEA